MFDLDGKLIDYIYPEEREPDDRFGWSVSISGDTFVVGAYRDNGNGTAHIYPTNWTDSTNSSIVVANDGALDDAFGYSVAISGDIIVVGAKLDDDNATDSGSAYIFKKDGTFVSKIKASDGAENDRFGHSVDVSGDLIVVSTENHNENRGALYLFNTEGTQLRKITNASGGKK